MLIMPNNINKTPTNVYCISMKYAFIVSFYILLTGILLNVSVCVCAHTQTVHNKKKGQTSVNIGKFSINSETSDNIYATKKAMDCIKIDKRIILMHINQRVCV